jgi:hypothetical protein
MDDALRMRRFEGFGDLPRDGQRLVEWYRAPREALREVFAVDVLHDERPDGLALFQPMDMSNVRMIERCERPRFACEPGDPVGIAGEGVGKDLQGNVAVQRGVAGAIHLAHPARANGAKDLIRAETRAGNEGHRVAVDYMGSPRTLLS